MSRKFQALKVPFTFAHLLLTTQFMEAIVTVVCFYNQVNLFSYPLDRMNKTHWAMLFHLILNIYTPDLIRVAQNQWNYLRMQ